MLKMVKIIGCLSVSLAVLVVCIWVLQYAMPESKGNFTVKNISNSMIEKIDIGVCQDEFAAEDIEPGEERQFTFVLSSETGYQVNVTFADGRTLSSNVGYVTGCIEIDDVILIGDDEIGLESNSTIAD